jgi:hypothetical protein
MNLTPSRTDEAAEEMFPSNLSLALYGSRNRK